MIWDAFKGKSHSSPAPRAARAAVTRSGWPRRAPTSSPSTGVRTSTTIGYPMATPEDLEETAQFVEKTGQRVVTAKVDVQ